MVLLDDGENIFTVDPDALHDEWELLEVALDCMFDLQKSHTILETMQDVVCSVDANAKKSKIKRKRTSSVVYDIECPKVKKQPSTPPECPTICTSEVMLVGEPILMGGMFGNEDERIITRLKNSQYSSDNNGKESNSNDEAFVPHITCQPPSTLEVPIVRQTKQIDRSINEQLSQLSEEEWLPVNIKRTTNNAKDDVHERNRSCDY